MERISIQELEKMTNAKYICTQKIKMSDEILGDEEKHTLEFDVFDGFAYCPNYKGKEFWMNFPKKKFIDCSKDMSKTIREYLGMEDDDEITEKEIMIAYSTLYVNA